MKINLKKSRKVLFLSGILGFFALMDLVIGLYDLFFGIPLAVISSLILGVLLIFLGSSLLFSAYGIYNSKRWGYLLALAVVILDLLISGFLLWKLSQPYLFLDILVDLVVISGILYVGKEEGIKLGR